MDGPAGRRPPRSPIAVRVLVGVVAVLLLAAGWWLVFAPAPQLTSFAGDIKPQQPADYLSAFRRRIAPVRLPAGTPPPAGGTPTATPVRGAGVSTATVATTARVATTPSAGATATGGPVPTATLGPALTPLPVTSVAATSTLGPANTPMTPTSGAAAPTSTLGPTLTPRAA